MTIYCYIVSNPLGEDTHYQQLYCYIGITLHYSCDHFHLI